MGQDASSQPEGDPGAASRPEVLFAPELRPSFAHALGLRTVELATFVVAVIGALALGLGITDYLGDHLEVLAYLAAYVGFRVALIVMTAHTEAIADLLKSCSGAMGYLPALLVFAAAPFERTYFYAGGEPPIWLTAAGLAMGLVGFWIALLAQIQIDRALQAGEPSGEGEPLIRTGLFRYVRHPSYAGQCLAWMGWPAIYGAPITAVVMLLGGAAIVRRQIRNEEAHMFSRFGEQYAIYANQSERLVPGVW
jgi:protein-S-isoprenylcysteine O-methyltransferase Ste14